MKPNEVKTALFDSIQALTDYKWFFSSRPGKDNVRNRKFPFQKMIASVLAFKGGTLNHEIMDFYGLDPNIGSASAFVQQRAKILPEAFETLFRFFTSHVDKHELFHGFRLLAVDGSDLQIAANPHDPDSFYPGVDGHKSYNLLHINAMYDLIQCSIILSIGIAFLSEFPDSLSCHALFTASSAQLASASLCTASF